REVYLTVGSTWGQFLIGRELALFGRQNILNDQTLFGVGAVGVGSGQGGGTTLGRIGYGYIYPNFQAQATYTTKPGQPMQLAVGIFQPSIVVAEGALPDYVITPFPRVEAEFTFNKKTSSVKWLTWAGGLLQRTKNAPSNGNSLTSVG